MNDDHYILLSNEEAIALQAVRDGNVYYHDTETMFVGLGRDNGVLGWADDEHLLTVVWRERQWNNVPVRLSPRGEAALRVWKHQERRRNRRRSKSKRGTVA